MTDSSQVLTIDDINRRRETRCSRQMSSNLNKTRAPIAPLEPAMRTIEKGATCVVLSHFEHSKLFFLSIWDVKARIIFTVD